MGMLDRFQSPIAAVMETIANASDGVVLVHCAAGKDRTGLICALLLGLAGVPRETIAADYALSAECLRPRTEEWLQKGPGERAERELVRSNPRAEVMLEVLDYIEAQYGGVEAYLLEAGLVAPDITRLRERLVGPTL
jgi:protein-tyrosine phosphatase